MIAPYPAGLALHLRFLRETLATALDGADAYGTHQGLIFGAAAGNVMCALDLPLDESLRWLQRTAADKEADEVMLSVDCFAMPDQGLTRTDLVVLWHMQAGQLSTMIVEYDRGTREMDPPRFDNTHWNSTAAAWFAKANGGVRIRFERAEAVAS